jgi:2-hydroxychromene-2-carboxylate isomerase
MSATLEFQFDFGSPYGYFCHRVIPAIEARRGKRFSHVPVLLGDCSSWPTPSEPMPAAVLAHRPSSSATTSTSARTGWTTGPRRHTGGGNQTAPWRPRSQAAPHSPE